MIDRIEFNIQQSVDYILAANADTKKAVKFQQEARRVSFVVVVSVLRMSCPDDLNVVAMLCLNVVVVVVVVIVVI